MENTKMERVLELFFRGLRGEDISVQKMADEYSVSTKSITRSINELKAFLADHRQLVGNTRLEYCHGERCYRLHMEELLSSKELFALVEVMIGARAFSREELLGLTEKLKGCTTPKDRKTLDTLIRKELYHYCEVGRDCDSVQDQLWDLVNCIVNRQEISIDYYRMDRKWVTHRLRPASVMFADYYFYLIAFFTEGQTEKPYYFRIDRIRGITVHRQEKARTERPDFDEGLLRRRSLYMWPGSLRTIRFLFTGPSIQAVLDKIPTAKIIQRDENGYLVEAEVYGKGIRMWLLSQGAWVKVIAPESFVEEMREEIQKMQKLYE